MKLKIKEGESLAPDLYSAADTPPSPGEKSPSPCVFCITGKMAAGKNFVASKIEKEMDFVSIDLDKTVHKAIELCTDRILAEFSEEAAKAGIELKNPDGTLNRRALGALLFPRPELLKKQEGIVYPKTIEMTSQFIEENKAKGKSVLVNATVLYKIPEILEMCRKIIFVTANPVKRFFRARKRDGIPVKQILQRFESQKNLLEEYRKFGKEIIIIKN